MPHGQREGPYGPPSIQREMPPYDAPPTYWGPPPPAPPRYAAAPPAHHHQHHPARSAQRVPPPEYHHAHHGAPPPPPPMPQYRHSPHYTPPPQSGQWRESQDRHYSHAPPPPQPQFHHSHQAAQQHRREMPPPPPREDLYGGRPYMPMQVDHPEVPHHRQHYPPPRTPPIQFRPTTKAEPSAQFVSPAQTPSVRPSSQKKQSATTSTSSNKRDEKKKKGDALSLLAKVSTAMSDPEDEAEKAAEQEKEDKEQEAEKAEMQAQQQQQQHMRSPPRRDESPVTMWTPTAHQQDHRVVSCQITPPTRHSHQQPHQRPPRSAGGGYYYPPRYAHSSYGGPPPHQSNFYQDDSPPAVISERGSFEDPAFGSPARPMAEDYAPYTYVQQPRLEDKTILRKKFSWKHYPELERFLIANRDEYLRHSALNYTAEQKQYNNWLTERLLEVAARHHYVFDPEDFNFVAVRDRIRCYYKSYVQTARKRGLPLVQQQQQQQKVARMDTE